MIIWAWAMIPWGIIFYYFLFSLLYVTLCFIFWINKDVRRIFCCPSSRTLAFQLMYLFTSYYFVSFYNHAWSSSISSICSSIFFIFQMIFLWCFLAVFDCVYRGKYVCYVDLNVAQTQISQFLNTQSSKMDMVGTSCK